MKAGGRHLLAIAALALAAVQPGAAADETERRSEDPLARGHVLIASRALEGSIFARSVVLLLEVEETGAVGLIVNRPMQVTLGELVPDEAGARSRKDRVYLGGPVSMNTLWLLFRAEDAADDEPRVLADVHASRHLTTLRRLLEQKLPPERFHAYMGYAGWAPRQLQGEIARGDWHVDRADPSHIFLADPSDLWSQLVRRHEGRRVRALPGGFAGS